MSDSYTNTNTRASTLNQAAAHDTGLYDPNVHDNQIVAMYETDEQARVARDTLISNGVPERAIRIAGRDQSDVASDAGHEQADTGFWGAIKSLFVPDEEAHGYAEGIRRGHVVLAVQPDASMDRHRVIILLESTGPVDFDAKLEEWRQAGYDYPGSGAAGAVGAAAGTAGTTAAMRATDTTAAGTFRNAPASSASENDYMSGARADDLPGGAYETPPETARSKLMDASQPARTTAASDAAQSTRATTGALPVGQDETIKVVEERLRVGKREVVEGAVRVRSYVVERP